MPTLAEVQGTLAERRDRLAALFTEAGDELKFTDEQLSEVRQLTSETEDLGKQEAELRNLEEVKQRNAAAISSAQATTRRFPHSGGTDTDNPDAQNVGLRGITPPAPPKSAGQLFIESRAFTEYNDGNHKGPLVEVDDFHFRTGPFAGVEYRTTMTEAAGFAPQAIRTGLVVDSAQQQPRVVDLIPSTTTTQTGVVYMRETTYTNNAAETAEAAQYPESALAFTEVTSPVRKIAVFIPVTDEQLDDIEGMRQRIDNRLDLMLRQRLDQEIVTGNGTPPNLTGILNTANIQTQAKGADPGVDAIFKAIVKARYTAFVEPSGIIINPTDWQNVRLLRTSTGEYIFGPPASVGMDTLWGLPVAQTTYMTAGTAIVGDFRGYSELAFRQGIEFEISNSHSDYFIKGINAIRAQLRVALVITRPAAFVTVTGL